MLKEVPGEFHGVAVGIAGGLGKLVGSDRRNAHCSDQRFSVAIGSNEWIQGRGSNRAQGEQNRNNDTAWLVEVAINIAEEARLASPTTKGEGLDSQGILSGSEKEERSDTVSQVSRHDTAGSGKPPRGTPSLRYATEGGSRFLESGGRRRHRRGDVGCDIETGAGSQWGSSNNHYLTCNRC